MIFSCFLIFGWTICPFRFSELMVRDWNPNHFRSILLSGHLRLVIYRTVLVTRSVILRNISSIVYTLDPLPVECICAFNRLSPYQTTLHFLPLRPEVTVSDLESYGLRVPLRLRVHSTISDRE